jgi:hypothetical protein
MSTVGKPGTTTTAAAGPVDGAAPAAPRLGRGR